MISVALCTYNGEKFIKEQINSIINQTQSPNEIIICDDCSSDKTIEIANSTLATWDGNIKIIRNEHNLGFIKNFEKAIALASGDIIFLSDQDDVWDSNKIKFVMEAFKNHTQVDLIFHNAEIVDEKLDSLHSTFWGDFNKVSRITKMDFSDLLTCNSIQGASLAFRKSLFKRAIPFPNQIAHDDWLALNAYFNGGLYPLNKCLLKYRQSNNNVLGAEPKGLKKIKKWILSYKSSITRHKSYLEYQITRWNAVIMKYSCEMKVEGIECLELIDFYKKRVEAIEQKSLWMLPVFQRYKDLLKNKDQAMKQYIKDLLSILV